MVNLLCCRTIHTESGAIVSILCNSDRYDAQYLRATVTLFYISLVYELPTRGKILTGTKACVSVGTTLCVSGNTLCLSEEPEMRKNK
jgi:hypothetical protein